MDDNINLIVSAIITTYKRTTQIVKRAISSIINQTYSHDLIEIIVVNDSPEDKELANSILSMIDDINQTWDGSKIKYIEMQHNSGACAARNKGIEKSTGELIAFLDDDDEWLPNKLELMVPLFIDNSVGLVFCDNYLVFANSVKYHSAIPNKANIDKFELYFNNYIGSTSFPVLRKKTVIDAGLFDKEMLASQDVDLWIRIASISNIAYVSKPLVNYYMSNDCITTNIEKSIKANSRMIEKYSEIYSNNVVLLSKKYKSIALTCIKTGHLKRAKEFKKKSDSVYKLNNIKDYFISYLVYCRNVLKRRRSDS